MKLQSILCDFNLLYIIVNFADSEFNVSFTICILQQRPLLSTQISMSAPAIHVRTAVPASMEWLPTLATV